MRSHDSSLWGFPDNILQGWFKMKTTSIFPVHGLEAWIYSTRVSLMLDVINVRQW